jgi:tRNA (guanine37-N1)-methyltransferase
MFRGPLEESLVRRAQERGLVTIRVHDLRAYTRDRHRVVDDVPYGGGAGMVLKPEPVFAAVEALMAGRADSRVVLLSPQGQRLTHQVALEFAARDHLILLCGRYEGFDERIRTALATDEVSIGDVVLSGGELAALVVLEAVVRLVPGVVGAEASVRMDSFYGGLLDYPQYTRPASFRGLAVPPVLLSGDHERIRRWRRKEALRRTRARRPDLLATAPLTEEDRQLLQEIADEEGGGPRPPPGGR